MGAPRKVGKSWHVEVRRTGFPAAYASFPTKAQALEWKSEIERKIRLGEHTFSSDRTLNDLLAEFSKHRKRKQELQRIKWLQGQLGKTKLADLTPKVIADWRDERLKTPTKRGGLVTGSSVVRDLNLLSSALSYGRDELDWIKENPVSRVRRPKENDPRNRKATEAEKDLICAIAGYVPGMKPTTSTARIAAGFILACETGLSIGEVCLLEPSWVEGNLLTVPMRFKTRPPRGIPLSKRARQVLEDVDKDFRLGTTSADTLWRKLTEKAKVNDLHFHDGRATFLTVYSKIFSPLELAKISGHRDLNRILNTYYRPSPQDLADKLAAHEVPDKPQVGQPVEEPRGSQPGAAF